MPVVHGDIEGAAHVESMIERETISDTEFFQGVLTKSNQI